MWAELRELVAQLDTRLRTELCNEWSRAASFEHASVASFNRFSLELLAVGAPADLVLRANRAALDEVQHASSCFELASAYAGKALGPGALDLAGFSLRGVELSTVARAAAEEGCVGETLAAIEATAAEQRATVAIVKAVLSKIAKEEAEHAALAYRFVRWAIEVGGTQVRDAARAGFDAALASSRAARPPESAENALWAQHGRLSAAERQAIRVQAISEVLEPTSRELFA